MTFLMDNRFLCTCSINKISQRLKFKYLTNKKMHSSTETYLHLINLLNSVISISNS